MKRSDDFSEMPQPDFGPQLDDFIRIRCPSDLLPALKHAAERQNISKSAYVRRAIVDRLTKDRVDLGRGI